MCAKLHTVTASNNRDRPTRSLYYCLCHIQYIQVLIFANIPFVVKRTFNAMPMERLQQHPLLFAVNCTDRIFLLWSLHLARPSHPGHSNILLRSESPSGMGAKRHTLEASNNSNHRRDRYRLLLVHAAYTWAQFGGGHGGVSPSLFQTGGHNMSCPPTLFSLGLVFGEVSKIKVMCVTFCVKSFSC